MPLTAQHVITAFLVILCIVLTAQLLRTKQKSRAETRSQARQLFESLSRHQDTVSARDTDQSPNEIVPGVFLGSAKDAANTDKLESLGVTAVLNLAGGLNLNLGFPASRGSFDRLDIPALDTPFYDLSQHFDACCAFIDKTLQSGGKVLVHCYAGVSRSTAIIAVYLQRKHGWTTERALWYIKGIRPRIVPNEGFIEQLLLDSELSRHSASDPAAGCPVGNNNGVH